MKKYKLRKIQFFPKKKSNHNFFLINLYLGIRIFSNKMYFFSFYIYIFPFEIYLEGGKGAVQLLGRGRCFTPTPCISFLPPPSNDVTAWIWECTFLWTSKSHISDVQCSSKSYISFTSPSPKCSMLVWDRIKIFLFIFWIPPCSNRRYFLVLP